MAVTELLINGRSLLVETTPLAGSQETGRLDAARGQVIDAFDAARLTLLSLAEGTVDTVDQMTSRIRPRQLEVEFGVKFTAQGNVVLAGASGEASLKFKLVYGPDATSSEAEDE